MTIKLTKTELIISHVNGNRERSFTVFFTKHGRDFAKRAAFMANDIHAFGPFRFSDTRS